MAYDSNIYREVMTEYEQLRQREQSALASRREEVYAALPRVREIDSELKEIGYSLSLRVISEPDRAEEVLEELKRQVLSLNQEKAALLREHHYSDDVLQLHYECPLCRDTGYIENRQCSCLKPVSYTHLRACWDGVFHKKAKLRPPKTSRSRQTDCLHWFHRTGLRYSRCGTATP